MKYYAFDRSCFPRLAVPSTIIVAGCISICCIVESTFVRIFIICCCIAIASICMFIFTTGNNHRLWQCRYMLSETGIAATIGKEKIELLWKDCRYFGWIPCPLRGRRALYFSDRIRYQNGRFSPVDTDGEAIYGRDFLSFVINQRQWETFCGVLPKELREALEGTSWRQQ